MTDTQFADDRLEHLEQLEEQNYDAYSSDMPTPTSIDMFCNTYHEQEEIEDSQEWVLAGRITRKNTFGDFSFFDIDDRTDSVQVMCRRDEIEDYDMLEDHINLGDHVVFNGTAGRSNTGELSLVAEQYSLSSKSLTEYSTEWNSLGERQRIEQRTSALSTDDDLFNSVRTRFEMQQEIRQYLNMNEFLEVETPTIDKYSGGAESTDFETYCEDINQNMSLRVAPELYLKRLITAGYTQIYEIARCYRNESIDTTHNPEFTMLELYQAYADYEDMMELTENLVSTVTENITGSTRITFNETEVDMSAPWERRAFDDLVTEYMSYEDKIQSAEEAEIRSHLEEEYNVDVDINATYDEVLMELFEEAIEPELVGPIFVTDYPTVSTPLCQTHNSDSTRVERFEVFVSGMEIANAYTELTNPVEQYERISEQGEEVNMEFINAISNGMPPTGGLGIGLDRLAMILTDSQSIKNVIPYPLTYQRV